MIIQQHRIDQLRAAMEQAEAGALLITHVPHVAYLTGFSGSNAVLLILPDVLHFITDARYAEQVKTELVPLRNCTVHIQRDVWKYIAEQQLLQGAQTLGVESAYLSLASAQSLQQHLQNVRLQLVTGIVEAITMVKTEEEVAHIRAAAAIAERTYDHVLRTVRAGMTEQEVAAEVAYVSRKLGSEADGFDTIVASGARGALPHGQATQKTLQHGELVTLDFGCRVQGFYSDMTRTFALGEPSMFDRGIYELVLRANEAACAAAHGGMNVAVLDGVARSIIEEAGYGAEFLHSLGHGLGREVHERPSISYRFPDDHVPEGAVFTIEPGVYVAERCGVRIEDNLWLTGNGAEILTLAPKYLIVVE
jgi:Xaa-Pro aminopeptidase